MSIGSYSSGETPVAAQIGVQPPGYRPAPRKRRITAKADTTQQPEPR